MEGSKNPEWLYLRELFDVLVPASLLVYAVVFKSNNIDDYAQTLNECIVVVLREIAAAALKQGSVDLAGQLSAAVDV